MTFYSVGAARISDASQIGEVGHASWQTGIGVHLSQEAQTRITPETFASFARAKPDQIIVARDGGTVLGFSANEDADDYISDLWVSPNHQGRGIGTALLRAIEKSIADRGFAAAEIEVLTRNERAAALYRRLGYETVWQQARHDTVLQMSICKTRMRKAF